MPAQAALASVGVEAIVKGLEKFTSDMGKMDKSITGLIPANSLLGRAFTGLGNVIQWLTGSVMRVLEYTLGNLLASAIQGAVREIQEMISSVMESVDAYQKLEVRLNRFNLNEIKSSYADLAQAQQAAIEMTQEQLRWLNKLAARTPFNAQDIAQTYALARSYGFASESAKELIEQISEFASGMGLSEEHIERIIVNFGQLKAAGKITGTEIRDLARGAFVPVNDILDRVSDNLGITRDQLDKLRKKGLSDAETFFLAFGQMVDEDFTGATKDMNRVLSVSIENIKDMARAFLSLEVVKPIIEILAERASDLQQALYARWDEIEAIFSRIGAVLSEILKDIVGLGPSAEEMADGIVGSLDMVAGWLEENKDGIVSWVKDSAKWIKDELIPGLQDVYGFLFGNVENTGAIQKFGAWLKDDFVPAIRDTAEWIGNVLVPHIQNDLIPLFLALLPLGTSLKELLFAVLGQEPNQSLSDWIHDTLIPAIQDLTKWINENRDTIASWIEFFVKLFIILEIAGIISKLISLVIFLAAKIALATIAISLFWSTIVGAIAIIGSFIATLFALINIFTQLYAYAKIVVDNVSQYFQNLAANISRTISEVKNAMLNGNWWGVGRALVEGWWRGINDNAWMIYNIMRDIARNALYAVQNILGIRSPSKEFAEIGFNTVRGFAEGITQNSGMIARAMAGAAGTALSVGARAPAMMASVAAPSSVTNTTTNNLNLTVNSNAPVEPIIQDFNMLSSLLAT